MLCITHWAMWEGSHGLTTYVNGVVIMKNEVGAQDSRITTTGWLIRLSTIWSFSAEQEKKDILK